MNKTKLPGLLALAALAATSGAALAADASLDRAALLKLADGHLGALVAHEGRRVGVSTAYNSPTGWE